MGYTILRIPVICQLHCNYSADGSCFNSTSTSYKSIKGRLYRRTFSILLLLGAGNLENQSLFLLKKALLALYKCKNKFIYGILVILDDKVHYTSIMNS